MPVAGLVSRGALYPIAELVSGGRRESRRGEDVVSRRGERKYTDVAVNAAPRVGTERESPTKTNADD
jgi:hypothetical protein